MIFNTSEDEFPVNNVPWFHCLGEVNLKDNRLGNSFLKNGAIRNLFDRNTVVKYPKVVLFGKEYKRSIPIMLNNLTFFKDCRKNYLVIYECALKTDTMLYGARVTKTKNRNYSNLRKEICVFMNYIPNFIANYWNDNSLWVYSSALVRFINNLSSFWLRLERISGFPKYVTSSDSSVSNKCFNAPFHLLHIHLDLMWYRLVILYRLEQLVSLVVLPDASYDIKKDTKQCINSLIEDLFLVSVSRFEELLPSEVKKKSPFPCTCVKEMWLLIQIFIDKQSKESLQNEFWSNVNSLCSRLSPPAAEKQENGKLLNVTCSNPVLFSLWILFHLGQLYSYSEKGQYIGSSCDRMVSNYPFLDKILKLLLSVDIVSEAQLRLCIPLITELLIDLWPSQREPVCKLWEHFHHRLNGCFFLPGASADTVAITCSSGAEMLLQASHIMDPPLNSELRPDNSFYFFLRLLGSFLRKNPSQWPNIKGRIFSKFSQTKMQSLKEMGIFNFSILFLCMALAGHTKEVGGKMQELLNQCTTVSLDLNRRLMIWKAHLALLQLYIQKELDIADPSDILMEDVNHISGCKDPNSVALLNTLTRGLKDIIMTSKTLAYSEHKIIGNWINFYLKLTSESGLLIETLSEIIRKILDLSKSVGMIEYNASESHLTKMYLAVCKHLLPYIKEKFANSDTDNACSKLADLAATITLLALNRNNVGVAGTSVPHLFESFAVNANPLNAKLSIRYVCVLLQEKGILSELMETYSNYELLIIQTWIRCSVYAFENDAREQLSKLTQIVCQMPSFLALCQEGSLDVQSEIRPVDSFISVLGQLFLKKSSLTERSDFREKCLLYLTPMVRSFERMLRNKDVNEKLLHRIYEVAAHLILQCGTIIYSKSQPYCIFNSLVNTLLLPVAMFKPGVEMPSSILYAVRNTFPMFVKGIVKLNIASGNSLASTIKNLVVRYFPRLVGKSPVVSKTNTILPGHPLILCFDDADDEVPKYVLEIISQSFLKVGDTQCMNALMFLLEILQEKQFNEKIVKLFIDISLIPVLEVIILSDANMLVIKRQAIHLLKEVCNNKINGKTSLRECFWYILWGAIQRHIVMRSVNIMSLLCKMCEVAPDMMMDRLHEIKGMMNSPTIFHRANVANTIRLGVESMEKLLSLSKQQKK